MQGILIFPTVYSIDTCCTIRTQNSDYFRNRIYRPAFIMKQKCFLHELNIHTNALNRRDAMLNRIEQSCNTHLM